MADELAAESRSERKVIGTVEGRHLMRQSVVDVWRKIIEGKGDMEQFLSMFAPDAMVYFDHVDLSHDDTKKKTRVELRDWISPYFIQLEDDIKKGVYEWKLADGTFDPSISVIGQSRSTFEFVLYLGRKDYLGVASLRYDVSYQTGKIEKLCITWPPSPKMELETLAVVGFDNLVDLVSMTAVVVDTGEADIAAASNHAHEQYQQMTIAWVTGDLDGFMAFFADDCKMFMEYDSPDPLPADAPLPVPFKEGIDAIREWHSHDFKRAADDGGVPIVGPPPPYDGGGTVATIVEYKHPAGGDIEVTGALVCYSVCHASMGQVRIWSRWSAVDWKMVKFEVRRPVEYIPWTTIWWVYLWMEHMDPSPYAGLLLPPKPSAVAAPMGSDRPPPPPDVI